MARYPGSEDETRVPHGNLKSVVAALFAAAGTSEEDAELVADSLSHADLRGIHSHGVMRVPLYISRLLDKGVNPRGRPHISKDAGAALVVDGDNAMGQVAATFAMEQAIERALQTGVAVAAVGGSNHCGAMDYYALMALRAGMIGMASTNALPTMAPWGGAERILGINPLAISMPTAKHPPLVIDTSWGGTARGKIQVYHQKGLALGEGWAFDADGRPTTDPAAALDGLIAPAGNYKGTGYAMMMGMLCTVLSGAAYGTQLGSLEDGAHAGRDGQFMVALNVAAFEELEVVKARSDEIVDQILACRRAPGFDEVVPPGLLEHELEAEFRADGIPLNDATLDGIRQCADRLGVDASALG